MINELVAGETPAAETPTTAAPQWKPGQSGNLAGRPKGSKNRIVELQQKLEVAVRESISADRIKRIVNKLCEMAEGGNIKAAKLILDKTIANASPVSDEEAQDNGTRVVFQIVNATFAAQRESAPEQPAAPPQVVDAEFVESPPTDIRQDQDGHEEKR